MGSLRDLMRDKTEVPKPFRVTRSHRFNRHFQKFVLGAQKIIDDYYLSSPPGTRRLSVQKCRGRDLARIVSTDWSEYKSAWCFVDLKTGDVLRVESWRMPGRPRGNIFDESNGLGRVDARGPMYRGSRKG